MISAVALAYNVLIVVIHGGEDASGACANAKSRSGPCRGIEGMMPANPGTIRDPISTITIAHHSCQNTMFSIQLRCQHSSIYTTFAQPYANAIAKTPANAPACLFISYTALTSRA